VSSLSTTHPQAALHHKRGAEARLPSPESSDIERRLESHLIPPIAPKSDSDLGLSVGRECDFRRRSISEHLAIGKAEESKLGVATRAAPAGLARRTGKCGPG